MDRTELTTAIAAALFLAVMLGWTLRWLFSLLNTAPPAERVDEHAELEHARTAQTHAEAELASVQEELSRELMQTRAELEATMDGLRNARAHAAELQAELDRLRAGK